MEQPTPREVLARTEKEHRRTVANYVVAGWRVLADDLADTYRTTVLASKDGTERVIISWKR